MRSCIYCGRDLEKDEKCTCAGAMSARRAKENTSNNTENTNSGWQESTYRTGYTKKKRKFSFKKPKFKKPSFKKPDFAGKRKQVSGFLNRFISDPVNAVSGAGMLKPFQIILILVVTALFVSLSGYFVASRFVVGIYKIGELIKYTLSGTFSVFLSEILLIFVIYLANKFVFRQNVRFITFASRPVAAFIPLMLFSVLGVLVNFFSIYATIMFLLTGAVMSTVLVYEAMRAEWGFASASKALYTVGICYFIFFVILFNFYKLF